MTYIVSKNFKIKRFLISFEIYDYCDWKIGFSIFSRKHDVVFHKKDFYKTKNIGIIFYLFYRFELCFSYITNEKTTGDVLNVVNME